jgi:uncharacterized protein YijF (DUF1287 family)
MTTFISYQKLLLFVILFTMMACNSSQSRGKTEAKTEAVNKKKDEFTAEFKRTNFFYKISDSAISLTNQKVVYDAAYFTLDYPNGDVPADKGVCTDVVIRAYRKLGIDLQKEVHEDMAANFAEYPKKWGLRATDKNIDHRRVPNLMKFFERKNASLPITNQAKDYSFGDIICWDLGGGLTHIGILIAEKTKDQERNLVVHNIGNGQEIADCLFSFQIIGHYRFKM